MKTILKFIAALALTMCAAVAQPTQPISNARFQGTSLVNSGASLAASTGGTLTATGIDTQAHVSATLDLLGSTRGSILYRGASGWTILTPGTTSYVLTSAGAGADPAWALNNGLPAQSGHAGEFLTTNGTVASWAIVSGSGTVTSFSSGNLSPLFTTNVATPTITPALTFTLSTQAANRIFAGPTTGSAAAPTFRALVTADLPSGVGDVVGPSSATDNALARFDSTTGKVIQNSVVTIADTTGAMAGLSSLTAQAATSLTLNGGSTGSALVVGQGTNANITHTPSGTGWDQFAGAISKPTVGTAGNWSITSQSSSVTGGTNDTMQFGYNWTNAGTHKVGPEPQWYIGFETFWPTGGENTLEFYLRLNNAGADTNTYEPLFSNFSRTTNQILHTDIRGNTIYLQDGSSSATQIATLTTALVAFQGSITSAGTGGIVNQLSGASDDAFLSAANASNSWSFRLIGATGTLGIRDNTNSVYPVSFAPGSTTTSVTTFNGTRTSTAYTNGSVLFSGGVGIAGPTFANGTINTTAGFNASVASGVARLTLITADATTAADIRLQNSTGSGRDIFIGSGGSGSVGVNKFFIYDNTGGGMIASGTGSAGLSFPQQITSTLATGTAPFVVASTTQVANLNAATAGSATNATNTAITDDTTTNATMYPTWVTANTGNLPQKVTSTKLTFNPSTGILSSTSFTGAGTGLTGTAASLTAGTASAVAVGGITGLGTGVAAALAVNNGTAGAFQVNNASGSGLTSLTAANISTGALANGMTATSQSVHDNSTKLATTLYADRAALVGNAPNPLTESAGATTIDWSLGQDHTLTLNANLATVAFSNATSGQTICVTITNTASNYTVTWGNSIKWVANTQPTQTVGAHTDVWTIKDLGGTFYGSVVQNF